MDDCCHTAAYEESRALERRIFDDCIEVHALPPVFHYWSQRHLRAKLLPLGIPDANDVFRIFLKRHCQLHPREPKRFASLGSGNCDMEIALAAFLRAAGCGDFVIDCLELNPAMLERGRNAAAAAGLSGCLTFIEADLNEWNPAGYYHAAIAIQSLHHVVNLENLFAQTKRSLLPGGCLIASDMIGRNGHQRWPEALEIVQEFWRKLPPSCRYNRKTGIYYPYFEDWDCSVEGFEGVRSQDILPLLLRDFHFELFLPFGNVIDPFVDRCFGPNFDVGREWDRNFIDQVHWRDEEEIASGRITPTHMLAVVGCEPPGLQKKSVLSEPVLFGHLTPEFCVRRPDAVHVGKPAAPDRYEWKAWPPDVDFRQELAAMALCRDESSHEVGRWTAHALLLEHEMLERTKWALQLGEELARGNAQLASYNRELEERTAWAFRLRDELEEAQKRALQLTVDLEQRNAELQRIGDELRQYLRNPLSYIARIAKGIGRWLGNLVLTRQTASHIPRGLDQ